MEKTPKWRVHSDHYLGGHVRLIVFLSGYLLYIARVVLMVIPIDSQNLSFPLHYLIFEVFVESAINLSDISLRTTLLHE